MRLQRECILCTIRQAMSVSSILQFDEATAERVLREVLTYLSGADYSMSTPEIMGGIWSILLRYGNTDDPYRAEKRACNAEALKMAERVTASIEAADDPLQMALHYAAAGNLIDFAPQQAFSMDALQMKIDALAGKPFYLDDGAAFVKKLETAKSLLYLCDNCGEIVFDKLLMRQLQRAFPKLAITCAVRGRPVINDATLEDAAFVGLSDVATVIDNGDDSAGTVLSRVSPSFRQRFFDADIVLSKGQGNYESVSDTTRGDIFYLFTVKCEAVRAMTGVPIGSTVLFRPVAHV